MGTYDCEADKAKSELAAGVETEPGNDFPTSKAVQAPIRTGAQGLLSHAVLRQLKGIHGICNISFLKPLPVCKNEVEEVKELTSYSLDNVNKATYSNRILRERNSFIKRIHNLLQLA
jgi:hypothetical protein